MAKYITSGGRNVLHSAKDVKNLLNKKAKGITTTITKSAQQKMQSVIHQDLYKKRSESKYYKRTGDFLRSISNTKTENIGNGFYAEVFVDINAMRLTPPSHIGRGKSRKNYYGTHMNFKNQDMRNQMFELQEFGYIPERGLKKIRGVMMQKKTNTWLKNIYKRISNVGIVNDITFTSLHNGDIQIKVIK